MNTKTRNQLAIMVVLIVVIPILVIVYQVRKFLNGEPALQTYQAYNDPTVPREQGETLSPGTPAPVDKYVVTEKIALNTPESKNADLRKVVLTPEKIQQVRTKIKSTLASVYTAEKAYFAEFDRYTIDFKEMGFYVDLNNSALDFKFGFSDSDSDQFIEANQYSSLTKDINIKEQRKFCKADCTIRNDGFEVMTATNLDSDPDLDVWTINQNKELEHVFDDLAPVKK